MASGSVVRIGDSVSCGDHARAGSPNVFFNGMPVTHQGVPDTTGHGCFPPSIFIGPWSTTVFCNNHVIALKDKTKIKPHKCGKSTHDGIATTGSGSVFVEAS